jgi:hypothetical protein
MISLLINFTLHGFVFRSRLTHPYIGQNSKKEEKKMLEGCTYPLREQLQYIASSATKLLLMRLFLTGAL